MGTGVDVEGDRPEDARAVEQRSRRIGVLALMAEVRADEAAFAAERSSSPADRERWEDQERHQRREAERLWRLADELEQPLGRGSGPRDREGRAAGG